MLRAYRRSDLAAMVELDERCFDRRFQFSVAAMRRFAEGRRAYSVVSESSSGCIEGFVIVELIGRSGPRMGYCVTLDVAPEARRSGLGRRMLGDAERWAEAQGAVGMTLHVWVENVGAIRFYEGLGYRREAVVPEFYGAGGGASGMDALVYGKRFGNEADIG